MALELQPLVGNVLPALGDISLARERGHDGGHDRRLTQRERLIAPVQRSFALVQLTLANLDVRGHEWKGGCGGCGGGMEDGGWRRGGRGGNKK